jgi:hypothetical protein
MCSNNCNKGEFFVCRAQSWYHLEVGQTDTVFCCQMEETVTLVCLSYFLWHYKGCSCLNSATANNQVWRDILQCQTCIEEWLSEL